MRIQVFTAFVLLNGACFMNSMFIQKKQPWQVGVPDKRLSFATLQNNEAQFCVMPTRDNSLCAGTWSQDQQERIVGFAETTYPITHIKTLGLLQKYLDMKQQDGSALEKLVYTGGVQSFVHRLLSKRPLAFLNPADDYVLRHGMQGKGGFTLIGSDSEQAPLTFDNYISYSEMALSALVGMSTPTFFINDGNRNNNGYVGSSGTYEREGVYVGLVGARFEKPGYMEYAHMLITRDQNTQENGYGFVKNPSYVRKDLQLWEEFYETSFPTYEEAYLKASSSNNKGQLYVFNYKGQTMYLNTDVYKKRMRAVIEPFLFDADRRAGCVNKEAYVHAVGLGLGVWQVTPHQAKLMLDVYADVIQERQLTHVTDVDFSWFPESYQQCGTAQNGDTLNGVKIHFSKRNPADKLKGYYDGKLLVAQYAWDANAYPGNEYWMNSLNASGDPAAACCSLIPSLQNPLVNPCIKKNTVHVYPLQ